MAFRFDVTSVESLNSQIASPVDKIEMLNTMEGMWACTAELNAMGADIDACCTVMENIQITLDALKDEKTAAESLKVFDVDQSITNLTGKENPTVKDAQETLADKAKEVWKKFVELCKSAWNKIKEWCKKFYNFITGKKEAAAKDAETVKQVVAENKATAAETKKAAEVAKKIVEDVMKDEVSAAQDTLKALEKVLGVSDEVAKTNAVTPKVVQEVKLLTYTPPANAPAPVKKIETAVKAVKAVAEKVEKEEPAQIATKEVVAKMVSSGIEKLPGICQKALTDAQGVVAEARKDANQSEKDSQELIELVVADFFKGIKPIADAYGVQIELDGDYVKFGEGSFGMADSPLDAKWTKKVKSVTEAGFASNEEAAEICGKAVHNTWTSMQASLKLLDAKDYFVDMPEAPADPEHAKRAREAYKGLSRVTTAVSRISHYLYSASFFAREGLSFAKRGATHSQDLLNACAKIAAEKAAA